MEFVPYKQAFELLLRRSPIEQSVHDHRTYLSTNGGDGQQPKKQIIQINRTQFFFTQIIELTSKVCEFGSWWNNFFKAISPEMSNATLPSNNALNDNNASVPNTIGIRVAAFNFKRSNKGNNNFFFFLRPGIWNKQTFSVNWSELCLREFLTFFHWVIHFTDCGFRNFELQGITA